MATTRKRRPLGKCPMTPRMRTALADLLAGQDLAFERTSVGRPTKQRLAKWQLATYLRPRDWDGPMRLTKLGTRIAQAQAARAQAV